jgi:hypothetical protein
LKEYTYALIYNDPKLKDEWMEKQKESCDKWEYDIKSQKFITYHDCKYPVTGKEKRVWILHKYQTDQPYGNNPLRDRYCSVKLFAPVFLDGEFRAEDIMFIMSRIRGGVRDV